MSSNFINPTGIFPRHHMVVFNAMLHIMIDVSNVWNINPLQSQYVIVLLPFLHSIKWNKWRLNGEKKTLKRGKINFVKKNSFFTAPWKKINRFLDGIRNQRFIIVLFVVSSLSLAQAEIHSTSFTYNLLYENDVIGFVFRSTHCHTFDMEYA